MRFTKEQVTWIWLRRLFLPYSKNINFGIQVPITWLYLFSYRLSDHFSCLLIPLFYCNPTCLVGMHQVTIRDSRGCSHNLSRYYAMWNTPRPESSTIVCSSSTLQQESKSCTIQAYIWLFDCSFCRTRKPLQSCLLELINRSSTVRLLQLLNLDGILVHDGWGKKMGLVSW